MISENIKAKGLVTLQLIGPDGEIKESQDQNKVVDLGLAHIISRLKDTSQAVVSHVAIGTSGTVEAGTQTALQGTELARVGLDSTTIVTTVVANDSIQYVATFDPGIGTGSVQEAGLFNASSGPTMIARVKFDVVNKSALDTLKITWKIAVA